MQELWLTLCKILLIWKRLQLERRDYLLLCGVSSSRSKVACRTRSFLYGVHARKHDKVCKRNFWVVTSIKFCLHFLKSLFHCGEVKALVDFPRSLRFQEKPRSIRATSEITFSERTWWNWPRSKKVWPAGLYRRFYTHQSINGVYAPAGTPKKKHHL